MRIRVSLSSIILLILIAAGVYFYFRFMGATNGEILTEVKTSNDKVISAVREDGALTRARFDEKASSTDEKLNRLEGKLDRLLRLVDAPLPDGMNKL